MLVWSNVQATPIALSPIIFPSKITALFLFKVSLSHPPKASSVSTIHRLLFLPKMPGITIQNQFKMFVDMVGPHEKPHFDFYPKADFTPGQPCVKLTNDRDVIVFHGKLTKAFASYTAN